jgi:hypothetical protein
VRYGKLFGLGLVLALFAACSSGPPGGGEPTFSYVLDESLAPSPDALAGRPLAAVRDKEGNTSLFIANEILLSPADGAELNDFLSRYGGEVIGSDAIPAPPAELGLQLDPEALKPRQYTIRLDPSGFALDTFAADAERAGLKGEVKISASDAARLLALIAREAAAGTRISPNFVAEAQLERTEEHPDGADFRNAFAMAVFGPTGSRSHVTDAWRFVALNAPEQRTFVAIIDGGFWLDASGRAMTTIEGRFDIPEFPIQYDFVADDYVASGENLARCSGGSLCPWHGNRSASVAVGRLDNRYGAAGTGGLVADPMLFKTNLDWGQVARAIRTAVAWRADVISMSFGAECDNVFCDGFFEFNLFPALRNARDNGVVLVAAAGNAGQATNMLPCRAREDVICVGALADGSNAAIGYSNFGPHVDIFAPTNIPAMPDRDTPPGALANAGGTSASTPFVAGVAAMMRAYNPALTSAQVHDILRATAWTDSPDPKVTHYLNAHRAVVAARATLDGNRPPEVTITSPADGSSFPRGRVSVSFAAAVSDPDGDPITVNWSSNLDGNLGNGTSLSRSNLSFGEHTITATATDARGLSARDRVTLTIFNEPPTVELIEPADGSSLCTGETITFRADGRDLNNWPSFDLPDAAFSWRSSPAGLTGSGRSVTHSFASEGTYRITVRATDDVGLYEEASASISIVACSNEPPVVTITTPAADTSTNDPDYVYDGFDPVKEMWYTDVFLEGEAVDPEDGVLTGDSLVWTTNRTDLQEASLGTGTSLTTRLYSNVCQGVWHEVTLTATDSDGNARSAVRRIFIWMLC